MIKGAFSQYNMMEAGIQLSTTIQAQFLAKVEDNLMEHKSDCYCTRFSVRSG